MKKILQIIILLLSIKAFACDCDSPKITEKYIESDFVANVTIITIYPNQKNEEGYKADIKINELYKGDRLTSIYVYGRSDDGIGSSCDIHIPVNTKLIAYARKNSDGNYGVGMCSGLLFLDYSPYFIKKKLKNERELKAQKREIDILKIFKEKEISFTDHIKYGENAELSKFLEQFKGSEPDKDFGIYEIIFNPDLTIKNVIGISGFGNPIDQELIEIIEKTKWSSYDNGVEDKVPDGSKLLIGIYYYPEEMGNPSFLSQHYH